MKVMYITSCYVKVSKFEEPTDLNRNFLFGETIIGYMFVEKHVGATYSNGGLERAVVVEN